MSLFVACFCVSLCAFSSFMCLDDSWFGLGDCVMTSVENSVHSANRMLSLFYVYL